MSQNEKLVDARESLQNAFLQHEETLSLHGSAISALIATIQDLVTVSNAREIQIKQLQGQVMALTSQVRNNNESDLEDQEIKK